MRIMGDRSFVNLEGVSNMSAKKKKSEEARAGAPEKAPVAAPPAPPVEVAKDPKIASISIAEFKKTLQTAKHPASKAMLELVKQYCGENPPARGETSKGAWLVPNASQGTQTVGEVVMTVEGQSRTFNVHADTHVWAIIDLVQRLEKGEVLTLIAKGKNDESSTMKLGTMRGGKSELVKNLQFYSK